MIKFVIAALDPEYETSVVHVESVSSIALPNSSLLKLNFHLFHRPLMSGFIIKKTSTKVSAKYSNFIDILSPDLAFELLKHIGINNHAIELVDSQQPPYRPIYIFKPVELETPKAYIEINLANRFIRLSKSLAVVPILSEWKSNSSLQLYVNYWGVNNLIIKNQYLLPLIEESLDRLKRAQQFTH